MAEAAESIEAPVRRRRGLRLAVRALLAAVLVPVVFVLLVPVLLIGQEVRAPGWVTEAVEERAGAALGGGTLSFGEITLTVGRDLHPVVRLYASELRDGVGTTIARVPEVEVALSPRGLLLRRTALVQELRLVGPEITLRRAADGSVAIAFGLGAAPVGRAPSLAELPEAIDGVLEAPALRALEQVRIEGIVLNYEDARAGRTWVVDGGQARLDLDGGRVRLGAEAALLSGRDFVTGISLEYDSPKGGAQADIRVEITDVPARDIATQSAALSWLSVLDARLSARLEGGVAEDGALKPLAGTLDIGAGALRPVGGTTPVAFERARASLTFDPGAGTIRFGEVSVASDWGALSAEGVAYMGEMSGGLPGVLIGQFSLSDVSVDPPGLYPAPLRLEEAFADFRLRLQPFVVEVGGFGLGLGEGVRLDGSGRVLARPEGWEIDLDARVERIAPERAMTFWPEGWRPGLRGWFASNLSGGSLQAMQLALRVLPEEAPVIWLQGEFEGAEVRAMPGLPPIEGAVGRVVWAGNRLSVALDAGRVRAAEGGLVDVAGSHLEVPDTTEPSARARLRLRTESTVTAALAILDAPPFGFVSGAGLPVTLAQGRAEAETEVAFRLMAPVPREEIAFSVTARLSDLSSEVLIPGRRLAAAALTLTADDAGMRVEGPLRIGQVPLTAAWSRGLGPGSEGSAVAEGEVTLSPAFLDEFGIALPRGTLGGEGRGRFRIGFGAGTAPTFSLASDLRGITLRVPAIGWTKAAGATGRLEVAGVLGERPGVDRLVVEGGGLSAEGRVVLREGGALDRVRFDRLRVGDWLDGAVTLVGRGPVAPVAIEVEGGRLDLARATFGGEGGEGGAGPIRLRLDRLQVVEGIALTGFSGTFTLDGGLSGQFEGAVNGGTGISGTVAPAEGRMAVRIRTERAGEAIRDAGFLPNARGGNLDLILVQTAAGRFDGRLLIRGGLRVVEAPALMSLLDAISVVGLLQQMAAEGMYFDELDTEFRLAPDLVTVTRSSAVGPGLGISLDGYYRTGAREFDFQGVVSPVYFLNAIGAVLTRPGEGLIGFNFTLRGPVGNVQVGVNPLSALTPGMFRDIFRRPPPGAGQ